VLSQTCCVAHLDANALCKKFAVIRRITEQQLARLCTLEVQVRWVFPGKADTAMDLNVFSGSVEVRL
jgi:hypothetical protein